VTSGARTARFRGPVASARSQHIAGAVTVAGLCAVALAGFITPVEAVVFFAVGAGAGYSLSGSV
jgi:hypothetical protein